VVETDASSVKSGGPMESSSTCNKGTDLELEYDAGGVVLNVTAGCAGHGQLVCDL
jgi:hypothetical protein